MCCDIYNEQFFVCWRPAQHTNMSLSVGLHLSETYPEVTNSMLHEKKKRLSANSFTTDRSIISYISAIREAYT